MKRILLLLFLIALPFVNYSQWTESFEGGAIPAGWSVINGGDVAQTWGIVDLSETELEAHDGVFIAAILYGATAHNDYLITPAITVTAGVSDEFSFFARSRDPQYPEQIALRLSTTTNSQAAFTVVLDPLIAPVSGANFYKYTYSLSAYAGQTVYIAFHSTTTDKFAFDVDLVKVGTPASCVEPTALVSSNVTPTSATVSWTAPASAPANGYEYYINTTNVAPTAFTFATGSVAAGVTSANITLTPEVTNYIWVRSVCTGATTSEWSTKLTVVAPFAPAAVPYSYGFETNQGWNVLNAGNGNNWGITTAPSVPIQTAAEGVTFASYGYDSDFDANAWLFSRPIAMEAGHKYHVDFKYRVATGVNPYPENLKLTIGMENTVAAQTTTLFDMAGITAQTWTSAVTTDFIAPTTGSYVLGFNCYSDADMYMLGVDDIMVTEIPLSVEDITGTAFTVYPNPTTDLVNISSNSGILPKAVLLTDMNGRIVKQFVNTTTFNVSDLAAGMYLLTISSDEASVTRKLVKK